MKKIIFACAAAALIASAGAVIAGDVSAEKVQKVIASSWKDPNASTKFAVTPDWASRLTQDKLQKACSQTRNQPDKELAADMIAAAKASIKYPEDGKFLGDWKNGEKIAQNGAGMRFNDKEDTPAGGNCYACHQIDKAEVAYGTIGPSLAEYGKLRDFTEEAAKTTYEKIYNSHVAVACSNMPRFGTNGILTVEQIKDVTALLMAKDSPVNK